MEPMYLLPQHQNYPLRAATSHAPGIEPPPSGVRATGDTVVLYRRYQKTATQKKNRACSLITGVVALYIRGCWACQTKGGWGPVCHTVSPPCCSVRGGGGGGHTINYDTRLRLNRARNKRATSKKASTAAIRFSRYSVPTPCALLYSTHLVHPHVPFPIGVKA